MPFGGFDPDDFEVVVDVPSEVPAVEGDGVDVESKFVEAFPHVWMEIVTGVDGSGNAGFDHVCRVVQEPHEVLETFFE